MTDPRLEQAKARLAALEAELSVLKPDSIPIPRGRRRGRIVLGCVLATLGVAAWVVAQEAVKIETDDNGTGEKIRFAIENSGPPGGTPANAYFLNSRLGVNTSAPGVLLDVAENSAIPSTGIRYRRTVGADGRISVGDPTKTWSVAAGASAGGDFNIVEETGGAGSVRMTVKDNTGRVGIGTTAPSATLETAGDVIASGSAAGMVRVGNLAAAPVSIGKGSLFFNTTDNKLYYDRNGTWTSMATGPVGGFADPGTIVIWSGSVASIPAGWALCDGSLGTPDLRDRFVIGAKSPPGPYLAGAQGGATTHTHTLTVSTASAADSPSFSHSHTTDFAALSVAAPAAGNHTHVVDPPNVGTTSVDSHNHGWGSLNFRRAHNNWGSGYSTFWGSTANQWESPRDLGGSLQTVSHSHSINSGSDTSTSEGAHGHTVTYDPGATASTTTGGHTHTTSFPATASDGQAGLPYYALCYIMKQ